MKKMRKIVLFLMAFLFCGFGMAVGTEAAVATLYSDCPEGKPYLLIPLSEDPFDYNYINKSYYIPLSFSLLEKLEELPLIKLEEIPDFPFEILCKKNDEFYSKLMKIKTEQQAILKWNELEEQRFLNDQKLQKENLKIRESNRQIEDKNNNFKKQKEIFRNYTRMIFYSNPNSDLSDEGLQFVEYSYHNVPNTKGIRPLEREFQNYLKKVEVIKKKNASIKKQKEILYSEIRKRNLEKIKSNEEIEQNNLKATKEFSDFYTPPKTSQLLTDYYAFLEKNCVGCEYEGELEMEQELFETCPNWKYVDGKYISKLKNEIKE